MAATLANWDALLKTLYTDEDIARLMVEESPLFDALAKDTNFVGRNLVVPVIYGGGQGISSDIATATSNATNTSSAAFTLTRKKSYGVVKLDRELIDATKGNRGAFVEAVEGEVDPIMNNLICDMGTALYGGGGGAIARLSATQTLTSTTVTLADAYDARKFEVGMKLQLSATDGTSGTVKAGSLTVLGVNRSGGTLTVDQQISTGVGTAAVSDYIFRAGNFGQGIKGLAAYIPVTAPTTGDSFLGVDRSVDERLYGLRHVASGGTVEEALIDAAIKCARLGASTIDTIVLSTQEGGYLIKELGSKAIYNRMQSGTVADFGYDVLMLHVPMTRGKGSLKVLIDPYCPAGVGYLLDSKTWKIRSLGAAPKVLKDPNGDSCIVSSGTDYVEMQFGAYWNISCKAPGKNMVLSFS